MTLAVNIAQGGSNNVTFRNKIINGAMVIDQRNAGASTTPTTSGTYTLDRWRVTLSVASKFSIQQSTTAPTGFNFSTLITSASAYSVGASEQFALTQFIEGYNTSDLMWGTSDAKTVTLSFWVLSSLTGTFGCVLKNNANDRSYPFTYTISSANTWEYETITIAGDTSGTWVGATNDIGLRVQFSLGTGSTLSTTAGAWASGNYSSATGAVSVVGTNGATFYITGVQLEAGTTASPFEYRQYGTELALCQRYYQQVTNGFVAFRGDSSGLFSFNPYVSMRTVPTSSLSGSNLYTWYASGANQQVTSVGSIYGSTATFGGITYALNLSSGSTGGQSGAMYQNTSASTSYLAFSAEL